MDNRIALTPQLKARVYPILVSQVYGRSVIGITATVVNASLLVYILWELIPHRHLTVWLSLILLVSLLRFMLCVQFKRTPDRFQKIDRWGRLLPAGLGLSGALWGSTAIFLFPVHSVTHQALIALVLAGMVAGAVGVFSPILKVFLAFSVPALTPILIRFFTLGDDLHMTMGAMATLFAILTFATAKRIHDANIELIALKETFADQLEERTVELKNANFRLTEEIKERRQTEKALADSQRRLTDIIEFLPDPTWVIDIEGRVIAWNQAVERITGIDKEEIIGKTGYAHAVPFFGKPRPSLIDLALKRDPQWEKEYLNLREKDGMLIAGESFHPSMGEDGRYFAATASRLYDTQGNVAGAIESIRDITAEKRAEQDRERLIAELQEAVAKIRTLSGLLPICASCKKIRDDRGYWKQIETFISEHSEAEFSHSICPECARKLYPDLDIYSE